MVKASIYAPDNARWVPMVCRPTRATAIRGRRLTILRVGVTELE